MLLLQKSPRRKKKFWRKDETELLIKCVDKYGKHWARIIKNNTIFIENGRTQVDLKDRWRNILLSRSKKNKTKVKDTLVLYNDKHNAIVFDSGGEEEESDEDDYIPLKKIKKSKKKSVKKSKKSKSKKKSVKKSKKSKKKSKKSKKKSKNSKSRKKSKKKSRKKSTKRSKNSYKIYSIKGCGYCVKAKELFKSKKIKYIEIKVTDENIEDIYKKIDTKTNKYRSFPIIFKNNKFIGGFADLDKNNL